MEGLLYIGHYPTLEGHGKARPDLGLNIRNPMLIIIIITTIISLYHQVLSVYQTLTFLIIILTRSDEDRVCSGAQVPHQKHASHNLRYIGVRPILNPT